MAGIAQARRVGIFPNVVYNVSGSLSLEQSLLPIVSCVLSHLVAYIIGFLTLCLCRPSPNYNHKRHAVGHEYETAFAFENLYLRLMSESETVKVHRLYSCEDAPIPHTPGKYAGAAQHHTTPYRCVTQRV